MLVRDLVMVNYKGMLHLRWTGRYVDVDDPVISTSTIERMSQEQFDERFPDAPPTGKFPRPPLEKPANQEGSAGSPVVGKPKLP